MHLQYTYMRLPGISSAGCIGYTNWVIVLPLTVRQTWGMIYKNHLRAIILRCQPVILRSRSKTPIYLRRSLTDVYPSRTVSFVRTSISVALEIAIGMNSTVNFEQFCSGVNRCVIPYRQQEYTPAACLE